MSEIKIFSRNVILVEGGADEIVPNDKLTAGMYGFAVLVPPTRSSEWFLDLVWRITIAYAGRPSLLRRRTMVRKMVEAAMSKESRDTEAARERGAAELARRDRPVPAKARIKPAPGANAQIRAGGKAEPTRVSKGRGKASARKRS